MYTTEQRQFDSLHDVYANAAYIRDGDLYYPVTAIDFDNQEFRVYSDEGLDYAIPFENVLLDDILIGCHVTTQEIS